MAKYSKKAGEEVKKAVRKQKKASEEEPAREERARTRAKAS